MDCAFNRINEIPRKHYGKYNVIVGDDNRTIKYYSWEDAYEAYYDLFYILNHKLESLWIVDEDRRKFFHDWEWLK